MGKSGRDANSTTSDYRHITKTHYKTHETKRSNFTILSVDTRCSLSHYKQDYFSLWNNLVICVGRKTILWDTRLAKGIHAIKVIYEDGLFRSFEEHDDVC